MSGFRRLVGEIHRRSLWQVLGIYVLGSWIALQVIDTLTSTIGLPDWFGPVAVGLLIVGLPIVLATAFVQEGVGKPSPAAAGAVAGADPEIAQEPGPDVQPELPPGPGAREVAQPAAASIHDREDRGGAHHRLFTWRNAIVGGVLAFALLGLATAGYVALRTLGIGPAGTLVAKGILEEGGRVILAEFDDQTGDPSLSAAVTEALRIDLAQSPTVTLVQPGELEDALLRMERDPASPIDYETAREIAIREGVGAVVAGEVNAVGGAFVLSARLHEAETGDVLVPLRETAKDSSAIISAIDGLSKSLRERIGESLRSVQTKAPLRRVTTASLPALRKYTQGLREVRAGDRFRAVQLLREAIELDSTFSQAYLDVAVELSNMGLERSAQVEALQQAFDHRARLPDAERYFVEATYYGVATGESQKAIDAYLSLLEIEPDHPDAANDLAVEYRIVRDHERALEMFRRALANNPDVAVQHTNTIRALVALGRVDDASAQLTAMKDVLPDHPFVGWGEAYLAYLTGDHDRAEDIFEALREELRGNRAAFGGFTGDLWRMAQLRGRVAEAEAYASELLDYVAGLDQTAEYLEAAVTHAEMQRLFGTDGPRAVTTVERALERFPLEDLHPLDRPYVQLAGFWARAGRPDRARELLTAFEQNVAPEFRGISAPTYHAARGHLALAEERATDAIQEFIAADTRACLVCALPDLAAAYDRAGQPDSAIAAYERYVATPFLLRLDTDAGALPGTYERLGQLYEEAGDLENAAKYYAAFVELWAEADDELQPRVRAAQARLEEILRERG